MQNEDFRKYDVWQLAHQFVLEIYVVTKNFPNNEQYGITSQIRRATISIPTNFSEGCGRSIDNEFIRYIHIALGSSHEVEYLLQLSFDLGFIEESIYQDFNLKVNTIKRKLYHLEKKIKETV